MRCGKVAGPERTACCGMTAWTSPPAPGLGLALTWHLIRADGRRRAGRRLGSGISPPGSAARFSGPAPLGINTHQLGGAGSGDGGALRESDGLCSRMARGAAALRRALSLGCGQPLSRSRATHGRAVSPLPPLPRPRPATVPAVRPGT